VASVYDNDILRLSELESQKGFRLLQEFSKEAEKWLEIDKSLLSFFDFY